MALVPQSGPSSAMSREGSRTALVVQTPAEPRDASALPELSGVLAPPAGTLRLRGGPRNGPRVAWDEAVIDNEGLGRKKSKSTYLALEKYQGRGLTGVCFKFVVSTTDQGGSTSHQMKKTRLRRIRARMTTLRGRVDSIAVIVIMWMGRGSVTNVESTSG
jgi:hypothetical protein